MAAWWHQGAGTDLRDIPVGTREPCPAAVGLEIGNVRGFWVALVLVMTESIQRDLQGTGHRPHG